ncbi:hypothetical protein [Limnothrix redekei]|uniref:Uncharacterized protein n=1 Tax=Limnothrix redekei LRLZ20PSL1 TaxID=3112953 RepID=A0ABW7CCZ7_9CYAN
MPTGPDANGACDRPVGVCGAQETWIRGNFDTIAAALLLAQSSRYFWLKTLS